MTEEASARKGSKTLFYGFNNKTCLALSRGLGNKAEFVSLYSNPPFQSVYSWERLASNLQEPWDGSTCNEIEFQSVLEHSTLLTECYSRHAYYSHSAMVSIQDYSHVIRSHYVIFKRIIAQVQPSVLVFANLPHEGFDNLLAILACLNNIQTYCCFQLPFAPKFVFLDLNQSAHSIPTSFFNSSIKTKTCNQTPKDSSDIIAFVDDYLSKLLGSKEYSYMTRVAPHPALPSQELYRKQIVSSLRKLNLNQALASFAALKRSLIPLKSYQDYLNRLDNITIDNERVQGISRYIYVPLHLQPELSTSALGSIYCDQTIMLSIAASLARMTNCVVLCKDNPKQSYPYRSSWFFDTCSSLKNVHFVKSSLDSRCLIKNALLVLTVTGTAGVEALSMGIPVYSLGDAWWNCLPGVSRSSIDAAKAIALYEQLLKSGDVDEWRASSFSKLRNGLFDLASDAYAGCPDSDYCEEFLLKKAENSKVLASSIVDRLEDQNSCEGNYY